MQCVHCKRTQWQEILCYIAPGNMPVSVIDEMLSHSCSTNECWPPSWCRQPWSQFEVSLKKKFKRSDKKSGRKKPRTKDVDTTVHPAPDSIQEQNAEPNTPKSKKKLKFNTPKAHHTSQKKETCLPAKKRKIPDTYANSTFCVGSLTDEHKNKIINNKELCSDIMNPVQQMIKRQFPEIQSLQPTERIPVWDEDSFKWKYHFKFEKVMSPAAQSHHNGWHLWR